MIRNKGQDYPISMLKVWLHDEVLDRLEWIASYLNTGRKAEDKIKTSNEVLSILINHTYTIFKDQENYLNGLDRDEVNKIIVDGTANTTNSAGNE